MTLLLVILLTLAGAAKAVADALAHGSEKLRALGPFFDNATSWQRKYRDYYGGDKRPRFFGSTTFLVFLTDGWHFFNALSGACTDAALLVGAWPVYRWYAVAAVVARRIVFVPLYALLRK